MISGAIARELLTVIARSTCDEAIQSCLLLLDCFTEPVIGPAKPDPLARNDAESNLT